MREYGRHIHFMVKEDTFQKIENACNNNHLVKSEFCRLCVERFLNSNDNNKIFQKDIRFKKQLIYEVRRFGNNLNQIAHKLNVALINDDLSYTDKLDIKSSIEDIKNIHKSVKELNILLNKRL